MPAATISKNLPAKREKCETLSATDYPDSRQPPRPGRDSNGRYGAKLRSLYYSVNISCLQGSRDERRRFRPAPNRRGAVRMRWGNYLPAALRNAALMRSCQPGPSF